MFHGLGEFIGKPFVGATPAVAPFAKGFPGGARRGRPYNGLSTVLCIIVRRHVVMPPYEGLSVAGM